MKEEIKKLEEELKDGLYDDNSLIDLVLYYKREIELLEKENKELYNKIEKTIEFLEPFVEWDLCTLKGTMLKKPLEILKGDKEN